MRIAVGALIEEANTFSPLKTTVETFQQYYLLRGQELFTGFGAAQVEVPGFLSVLQPAGVEIVPLLAASAAASGPLTRATFEALAGELIERLKRALPVDGVLLALHGSMTSEDESDCEGVILERARRAVDARIPIGVTLDLHGHITPRMLQPNTFLIGYREYPHIDIFETGVRCAMLMLETIAGKRHPVMGLAKRPMLLSPAIARTTDGPLKPAVDAARTMERSGRILHAALFPVQPWLDIPDLGFAVLVVADQDPTVADAAAQELADMVWQARDQFVPDLVLLEDAIAAGLAQGTGLTVVGDAGDGPSGGSAADNVAVLKGLLKAGADQAPRQSYLTLCDAEAARAAAAAGIGSEITLDVGHKLSRADGKPLKVTGRVIALSDGIYRMRDKGAKGLQMNNGLTAVLAIGSIRLAIRSNPSMEWDTALYTSVGLDLGEAALVFVKSSGHFRTAFAPVAERILMADTPGPTCANMRRLQFSKVTRPLYPLDEAAFR
ncbi:MAG: M81 family metallopeptidase [Proteobacteria bacterium]|nr:M81 family metallopeptidase [Pseudomonadota bacterium]MBI3499961.1 M81 family metallopeptidase [Pseudomonadota bacterium]